MQLNVFSIETLVDIALGGIGKLVLFLFKTIVGIILALNLLQITKKLFPDMGSLLQYLISQGASLLDIVFFIIAYIGFKKIINSIAHVLNISEGRIKDALIGAVETGNTGKIRDLAMYSDMDQTNNTNNLSEAKRVLYGIYKCYMLVISACRHVY